MERMCKASKVVASISFDIKGAFDHLSWGWIVKQLEEFEVLQYLVNITRKYFNGRKALLGNESIILERGCPQGSLYGPLLWNIGYNYVLESLSRQWIQTFAYADDTLLLIDGGSTQEVCTKVKEAIVKVKDEMIKGELLLNAKKTEILLLRKRTVEPAPSLEIGGTTIFPKSEIKYLGVWLDSSLSWEVHTRKMYEKTCKLMPKMLALARNTFGYNTCSRRIMLQGTVAAYFRYACAAYVCCMTKDTK